MASKIGILVVAFLSYVTLASGFFFGFPGFFGPGPGHDFLYPNANANDRVFGASAEQQRSNNGDGSVIPLGDGSNDQLSQHNGPTYGHAQPEHEPMKGPEPEPVQGPEPNSEQEHNPNPVQEPTPNPGQEPEPKPVQEPDPKPVQEPGKGGLREKFYEQSCPQAENIVNETIHKHFKKDPTYAAAFVRLFFHDCYVTVRSYIPMSQFFTTIIVIMFKINSL